MCVRVCVCTICATHMPLPAFGPPTQKHTRSSSEHQHHPQITSSSQMFAVAVATAEHTARARRPNYANGVPVEQLEEISCAAHRRRGRRAGRNWNDIIINVLSVCVCVCPRRRCWRLARTTTTVTSRIIRVCVCVYCLMDAHDLGARVGRSVVKRAYNRKMRVSVVGRCICVYDVLFTHTRPHPDNLRSGRGGQAVVSSHNRLFLSTPAVHFHKLPDPENKPTATSLVGSSRSFRLNKPTTLHHSPLLPLPLLGWVVFLPASTILYY